MGSLEALLGLSRTLLGVSWALLGLPWAVSTDHVNRMMVAVYTRAARVCTSASLSTTGPFVEGPPKFFKAPSAFKRLLEIP